MCHYKPLYVSFPHMKGGVRLGLFKNPPWNSMNLKHWKQLQEMKPDYEKNWWMLDKIPPSFGIVSIDFITCHVWWYIYITNFFFFGHVACKILILWPGIEPAYSAVKAQSPNNWTTREFPGVTKFKFISFSISMTLIMPFCCLKCHFLHKISFIRLKGQGKLELPLGTWLCSYNLKFC